MKDDLIILKILDSVYDHFRNSTRDGHLYSRHVIERKLTRAFILGKHCWDHIDSKGKNIQKRRYENLEIIVNLDDMIVEKIINHPGRQRGKINKREKEALGMLYGI